MLGWHIGDVIAPQHCKTISFVRHVNDLFMKYNIPIALLGAVRILAEGVNAEFTVSIDR